MRLVELDLEHQAAFLQMTSDYRAREPENFERWFAQVTTPPEFKIFLKKCEMERMDWRPKAGKISRTRYVFAAEDGTIRGNGVMRFPLNDEIERDGGNLIFDVPPSQRGHGYGALTLNAMLFEAVRAGMARALVTCHIDNVPARRAIEQNRGELEGSAQELARYWIRFR